MTPVLQTAMRGGSDTPRAVIHRDGRVVLGHALVRQVVGDARGCKSWIRRAWKELDRLVIDRLVTTQSLLLDPLHWSCFGTAIWCCDRPNVMQLRLWPIEAGGWRVDPAWRALFDSLRRTA